MDILAFCLVRPRVPLKKGAPVDAVAPGWSDQTPLLAAQELFFEGRGGAHGEKVLRLLVEHGADIDAADDFGYTMLITAAVNRKPALASLLVELGADTSRRCKDGYTALAYAQELGFPEIEELLVAAGARE